MSPAVAPPEAALWEPRRYKNRYWLHALLLVLTFITASAVGSRLAYNFDRDRALTAQDFVAVFYVLIDPPALVAGFPFALTLISILMAHEMGHYLACKYYRIDASLPYFLPAPTLIGTLGAFIRIRSPIYTRRELFDVGIAGPLAGFFFIIPAMAVGLAYSKVVPGIAVSGDLIFSTPGLLHLLGWMVFPGIPSSDIALHPVARAAWAGVLATALNLLPIGQLDGGHILYAFIGDRHRALSRVFVAALIPLGLFFSLSWLVWAVLLFFFGMRHPKIYDGARMGRGRTKLGWLALLIFVLSFTAAPVTAL